MKEQKIGWNLQKTINTKPNLKLLLLKTNLTLQFIIK